MKVGDLVQYVDPATRAIPDTPMPLVLLGTVLELGVKNSMLVAYAPRGYPRVATPHARVIWHIENKQEHWLPVAYLEVI
jgi:hypothetical protein